MGLHHSEHQLFDYQQAFKYNIGWFTENEQTILRNKTIALAGLGGVGGSHLLTLTRLGIENYHLAEMDSFELSNFNRQIGATLSSIDKKKIDVLAAMAKEINPSLKLKLFPEGLTSANLEKFLDGVDICIDAIDFFAINMREALYQLCAQKKIPCIAAAPLGMSCAYLIYMPEKMTFEDYFQFKSSQTETDNILNFIIGLNPTLACGKYLRLPNTVNLEHKSGPSLAVACVLCTGIVGTEAIKILLKRGPTYSVPHYHLFDAYLYKHVIGWMPFGNRNPLQRIKRYFLQKRLIKS